MRARSAASRSRSATVQPRSRGHALHHGVALGVDGAGVQRVGAVADAQEAGGLLEGLGAEPRHLAQLGARDGTGRSRCGTRRCCAASCGPEAGDVGEQLRLAVLTSTPTLLTQLMTTSSRELLAGRADPRRAGTAPRRWTWGRSSPARPAGPCRRRPMETAPRTVRSWSGNSSRATSEAE